MGTVAFKTQESQIKTGRVFVDFAVYNIHDEDIPIIELISFTGFPEHVEDFKKIITENKPAGIFLRDSWKNQRMKFKGNYRFMTEHFKDYEHSIAVSERINNINTTFPIIMVSSGENPAEKIFEVLKLKFTTPLSEKWADVLFTQLKNRNRIIPMNKYIDGYSNLKDADFYELFLTEKMFETIVTEGVKKKIFKIEGELDFDPHNINLTEYVKKHAHIFTQKLEKEVKPIYLPTKDSIHPLVKDLKREAFDAQAHTITAVAKALKMRNSVIVIGEMGTGKTFMSAAIPYIHSEGKPYRTLVMCPAHLTEKWEREIKNTVPNAKVYIINSWKDIIKLKKDFPKEGYEYYIISKDKAKLHYSEKPAFVEQKHMKRLICPVCGSVIKTRNEVPAAPDYFVTHTNVNHKCSVCGTKLWQADNKKTRRYAVSEYVKKYLKGYFDYFIADEVHELKGGDTAQGNAFGSLSSSAKKTIVLTGTLLGGYASDIFYILYRLAPNEMKKAGFRFQDETKFTEKYGAFETVVVESEEHLTKYNTNSRGKKKSVRKKKLPVISPQIFADFLMDKTVFIQLADLKQQLPEYKEYVDIAKPDPELEEAYKKLVEDFKSVINPYNGMHNLSRYLMTLLRYPDYPFDNETIDVFNRKITPINLTDKYIYTKEQKLLNLVLSEVEQERRVFIYLHFTGQKDVSCRLGILLNGIGIKTAVLKASINPDKREKWLKEKVKEGYKCIISNFDLVKTGLDLYDFPTLIFYETGYSTYTLRQAAKRSWRIGQTQPVKVVFMAYKDTMEYKALTLMGNKLEAAMNIEGHFSEDGLRALASSNDILTELAKSLIKDLKTQTSLESIWEQIDLVQTSTKIINSDNRIGNIIDSTKLFKTVKINDKRTNTEIKQIAIDFEALI